MAVNDSEFSRIIKGENIPNVIFIYGNEAYTKKHYIKRIVSKCVTALPEVNFNRFEGNIKPQKIFDTVMQMPMCSAKKCVLVTDCNFETYQAQEMEEIINTISCIPSTSVLIFLFDVIEVDYKKAASEKRSIKNTREIMNAVEKSGGVVAEINHKGQSEIIKMLCAGASKRGCNMQPTSARYLIETCSDDLTKLQSELDKLCSYSTNGVITNEMIDKVCVKTVDNSVFNLSRAIFSNDPKTAMKILDDIIFMGEKPEKILNILISPYIDLYRANAAVAENIRPESIAGDFGYGANKTFLLTNASKNLRNFSEQKIKLSLNALLRANKEMMFSRVPKRVILERAVGELLMIASKGETV